MKKHLYIDTNVYLTFFHFTNEDLNELKKLIPLINTDNIVLYLPEQTANEFYRNREVKISDSLNKLRASKYSEQFPMISHSYDEYKELKSAIKMFNVNKTNLLKKLQHDAENGTLQADEILNELFSHAKTIPNTSEIINEAVTRFNIGNPTGKGKSYGDAINWVCLLNEIPESKDLYFITEDNDYYSKLNIDNFNEFLLKEWGTKKILN